MTFDGDNEYQPVDFGHPFSDTCMEFTLKTMGASQNQSPILVQISSKFPVSLQCLGVWHFHFHCYGHLLMCFVFCFAFLSCDTKLVSVPLKEERRFVLQDNLLFLPYFSYFCDPVAFHNFRWVPTFRSATKCGQWKMVSVSAWTVYFGLNMWILYIYMYMYVYIY